jgi:tripartite-type tricarboxylate transporter receptor subunit TctC
MNPMPLLSAVRRRTVALALGLLACGVAAAEYPDKPIRLVVPFPAGGGADTIARTITPRLAQILGQAVIVDNRGGAGGNVGAEAVARAPADGYTLLYGTNGTHAINQALYGNLRFDPVTDFAPVSRMTEIALMLVVTPTLPVNTVVELVRHAKDNPGRLNHALRGGGQGRGHRQDHHQPARGAQRLPAPC